VPTLTVRKLDDKTVANLRVRAAEHGVSMEEEVRRILRRAVEAPNRMGDLAVRLFSPAWGATTFEVPEREVTEPLELPE
jgi:plasmid stability protein